MAIELKTYGDLKKAIKAISLKQKGQALVSQGKSFAIDQLVGLVPGASNVKTAFDLISAVAKKPDSKKTGTWIDKLDVDDQMAKIVDNTIENGFMQAISQEIESRPDNDPLEPDFNMNAKLANYLKQEYGGRFITGIKEILSKQLEEMSVTGGGEAYSTPFAFAKKGQKSNAAIQTAKSQGMKLAPTGIPSDSKIKDYKPIWKSAEKPRYKMYKETLEELVKQELLNEVTYSKFKKDVKHRTKSEQLHKAIREVKKKLQEIDRIVEYTSRMKQELSLDEGGVSYWKATEANIGKISEMMNHLNNKIKNLHQ